MKKLPKFKSEEEEARFWDTHSPLDYPNEFTILRFGQIRQTLTDRFQTAVV